MANYAVVRTDNMAGTDVRSMLVSIEYLGANGTTPTAIENGNVLKVGALKGDATNGYEREVYVGGAVAANDTINDVVLVASPELTYEHKALHEFINEAGKPARGYRFHSGDIFSVTIGALAGKATPKIGDVVEFAAGTKLNVAASATSGSTVLGSIIAIDIVGQYTYYVIKVA